MHVDNLEKALGTCKTVAQAGTFGAIVIDSLAGLAPKAQIDGDIGDSHVGLFPRIMSDALSVLTPYLDNSGCTLIVINQIREKVGVKLGIGYGNSKQFLKRLKMFGITYDELKRAVKDVK